MPIYSCISAGVEVSVISYYVKERSLPESNYYFFAYRIQITNNNDFPVQLESRFWLIKDSNGEKREVEGDGVIGETPTIMPHRSFLYESGCNFKTDIGTMQGHYNMLNLHSNQKFKVMIPEFIMMHPIRMN
jgi:ApaG protein